MHLRHVGFIFIYCILYKPFIIKLKSPEEKAIEIHPFETLENFNFTVDELYGLSTIKIKIVNVDNP